MIRSLMLIMMLVVLTGCSRERELRCESTERYQGARSVQPIRIPDDLSVPDESDALRIPAPPESSSAARETCLEYPPRF